MAKGSNIASTWRLLAAAFIVQSFCSPLLALEPDKRVEQYLVDQWGISDGIPSNTVKAVNQTPDGYLWIGTSGGLVRFDGMKFSIIPLPGKEGITPHDIRSLFVDRPGTLWVGTDKGLHSYQYRTGRLKTFTPDDGFTTNDGIRCIKEDMKGNLWIGFEKSYVNRFFGGEFFVYNAPHGLLGKKVNAILEDRQGNLLFGSRENGVFIYKDDKFFLYPLQGLDDALVITMYKDRQGELWIGTNEGLFRAKGTGIQQYTEKDGLSNDWVTSITEDSDRNLWVGTMMGLNRIKNERDGPIAFESLFVSFSIFCLFEDREESLWVGTKNSGLKRIKDGKFFSYAPLDEHLQEIPVSVCQDRHGDTWIGTEAGKLVRCRGSEFIESIEVPGLSGIGITAIAEDGARDLWLGTIGRGAFRKKNGAFEAFTSEQGLADDVVTSIFKDSRGDLWFATFDGVSVRRSGSGIIESLKFEDGLSGKGVYNIYEDRTGTTWIGTDRGITLLKDGKLTTQNMSLYLPGIPVTCIYEDPDSPAGAGAVFWIATGGAGLKRLQHGQFFSYTTAQGMTSNFLYQFLDDQQGNFWLMSESGILRVARSELNRFADRGASSTDKIHCTSFGISDGLKSLEFDNKFSRHSALKARDGQFWFITQKGISIVNPAEVRLDKMPPQVVIETVFINDQPFSHHPDAGAYTFKGISDLNFHFTAPTFLSPAKVSFRYRLEGFDRHWVFLVPGQERAVHYKELAPGTYTFSVTACNAEGVWNQSGASVTFTIKPLFYQTPPFKIAVLFSLMLLLAAAFYIYKKRLLKKRAKYKGSFLHPDFAEECINKLNYLMDIEKVYTDADIALQSLAEKMSVSTHQLSQLLNERLGRNFADFINSFRIEEAKKILKSPKGSRQKISAVAFTVGFNTTVAFYRAFKKFTKKTPSQYKEAPE